MTLVYSKKHDMHFQLDEPEVAEIRRQGPGPIMTPAEVTSIHIEQLNAEIARLNKVIEEQDEALDRLSARHEEY